MKKAIVIGACLMSVLLSISIVWTSCSDSKAQQTSNKNVAMAMLAGTKSDTTVEGMAKFTQQKNGKVKMDFWVSIPAMAGHTVAVHIHEHGDCGGAGKDAGGHWNPTGKKHGRWGSAEFHSGDIGNIELNANGGGKLTLETDLWSIGGDANTNILDKSIIIHSGIDDYTSQPAGNAGTRIGCGVIKNK
ncbi:MAG: superoxide dismutase family protein [Chitinophagaceae bacterium]